MTDPAAHSLGQRSPLAEWPRELNVGYEPLEILGRGGLSVVFRGRDRALGRQVAVKVLRPRVAGDLETVARVVRLAPAIAQLQHSNIVRLFAIERLLDGGTALVMQLVPGRTLKTELANGAVESTRAERVLFDVARALAYAHGAGLVHGDVKPENIFVDEISGKAILADLGIARVRAAPAGLTLYGSTIGTPRYMAPEQFDGVLNEPRSDLYSLGVVGWEMLSGQRAWAGESLTNVIHRQKLDTLPPLDHFRDNVPPRLQYLVEGLMAKSPDQRWASALLFVSVLASGNPPPGFHRWLDSQGLRRRQVSHLHPVPTPDRSLRGIDTPIRQRPQPASEVAPPKAQRPSVVAGSASVVAALKASPALPSNASPVAPLNASPVAPWKASPVVPSNASPQSNASPVAPWKASPATRVAEIATAPATAPSAPPAVDSRRVERVRPAPPPDVEQAATGVVDDASELPTVPDLQPVPADASGARRLLREVSPGENIPLGVKLGILGAVAVGALAVTIGLPARRDHAATVSVSADSPTDAALQADSLEKVAAAIVRAGSRGEVRSPDSEKDLGEEVTAPERSGAQRLPATTRISEATAAIDSLFRQLTREDSLILAADRLRIDSAILRRGQFEPELNDAPPSRELSRPTRQVATNEAAGTAVITRPGTASANGTVVPRESGSAPRRAPTRPLGAPVSFPGERTTVAAGMRHSCVLSPNGQALCWGSNQYGQLGDGSLETRQAPVAAARGLQFVQISAGSWHTCGLTKQGELLCWGRNESGQLGDGTTVSRSTPARVSGFVSFRAIRSGAGHTCAVSWDDAVRCWGANAYGELGDGSRQSRAEPIVVRLPGPARVVTAGAHHSCALLIDGSAYCWGRNHAGQLGNGSAVDEMSPVPVAGDTRFVAIAAGSAHTCAVAVGGRAWCWGENISGQLGAGTGIIVSTRPVALDGSTRFQTIAAGVSHTCALGRDEKVWCWGRNAAGQLGNGTTSNQPRPVVSVGVSGLASLNATGSHTCAASSSGELYCWGENGDGQLGHGSRNNATVPIRVRTPK